MEQIKLYTSEEIRDILKITQRTLYNYIKNKSLKAIKVGKYWRIRHEDLQDFLNRNSNI
jgi:excisionase family DNA binding protein